MATPATHDIIRSNFNWKSLCQHYEQFYRRTGTIHGDIKRQNMGATPDGQIQLFDWGISVDAQFPSEGEAGSIIIGIQSLEKDLLELYITLMELAYGLYDDDVGVENKFKAELLAYFAKLQFIEKLTQGKALFDDGLWKLNADYNIDERRILKKIIRSISETPGLN